LITKGQIQDYIRLKTEERQAP